MSRRHEQSAANIVPIPLRLASKGEVSELTIAQDFEAHIKGRYVYNKTSGKWLKSEAGIWVIDGQDSVYAELRDLLWDGGYGLIFQRASTVKAVMFLAKRNPDLCVTADTLDCNPWLLGTPMGTVDLRTGVLRASEPTDYITRRTAVAPAKGEHPHFSAFLRETTGGDEGLTRYLQQFLGYCLTGSVQEECMVFAYGPGGGGKGTLTSTIADIMGDYATVAEINTFSKKKDRHSADVAKLAGARLVTASETAQGVAWDEARIKEVTGGDKITARHLYQDYFDFRPQFKLLISGNHQPKIEVADNSMRRRVQVVPFDNKPERKDTELKEKLKAEFPQILQWAIDGCLDWQKNGLVLPEKVKAASESYFRSQDIFPSFLEDCTAEASEDETPVESMELFNAWRHYRQQNGHTAETIQEFSERMGRHGYKQSRPFINGRKLRCWGGLKLCDGWKNVGDRRMGRSSGR